MSQKKYKSFIGIDVCKRQLEVAAHESDYQFRGANKLSCFDQLIAELIDLRPALVVLEATGDLEIPVVNTLHAAGLPVVVVNPRQVRDFAKALVQLAKRIGLMRASWPTLPPPYSRRCGPLSRRTSRS